MARPSKGIAALLAAFLGPLGADKFYVGATALGVIQLVLSLTIIGLTFSVPWAYLSVVVLVVSILWGSVPMLYPAVNWAPTTTADKQLAMVIAGLIVLGTVVSIIANLFKMQCPPPVIPAKPQKKIGA